jgi:hypothetical protein
MKRVTLGLVFSLVAVSAHAQSAYVAATAGADVLRLGRTDSNVSPGFSRDSEAFSWSLRMGTAVGQNWGVEMEFVRSAKSRSEFPVGVPIVFSGVPVPPSAALFPSATALPNIPTPVAFESDTRTRHTDFDGVAWARQPVSGSVDLVYLGGVAFSRERIEITQTFPTVLRVFAPGGGSFTTTATSYGTHPLVGVEARIRMTSHMRLLPGIRVQGVEGGWLMRPYAGLGWSF